MIKNALVLLLCLAAIVGGAYVAVMVHRGYVTHETAISAQNAAVAAQQQAQAQREATEQAQRVQDELDALRQQCRNGLAAYNLLTTSQIKLHDVVKPACDL